MVDTAIYIIHYKYMGKDQGEVEITYTVEEQFDKNVEFGGSPGRKCSTSYPESSS